MPDGKVYFCIARAFEKGVEKHGMPKSFVSIGLGCDMKYAKDLVYSEGIDLKNKKVLDREKATESSFLESLNWKISTLK